MKFTPAQLHTIEGALSLAYNQYIADWASLQSMNQPRIAEQFDKQAKECRKILDMIQEST